MTDYQTLHSALKSLTQNVPHRMSNLANAAALLYHTLEDLNWAGFYFLEGNTLVLSAFQGKPACIEIPLGKGVCGTAVQEQRTLVVPDVHAFPGHIACDCASRSEIVIPLWKGGHVIGVLDIDSPLLNRFSDEDREGLEGFARILETLL